VIRVVAFALVFGLGVGMARNEPPVVHAQPLPFIVCLLSACALAYYAGRRRLAPGSATAVAVANARATASSDSRVNLVVVTDGARARAAESFGALDQAEWIDGGHQVDAAASRMLAGADPELYDHFDPADIADSAAAGELLMVPMDEQDEE
jgi:hypothetical protein